MATQLSADALHHLFNADQPFGPIKTEDIDDAAVLDLIFDRENRVYREMSRNPSVILGRRGAGKTAFLKSAYHDGSYDIVVELLAHEAFREIVTHVERVCPRATYPEEWAQVWDLLFWNSVIVRITDLRNEQTTEVDLLRQYVKGMQLSKSERGPYTVMRRVLQRFQAFPTDSTIGAGVRTVAEMFHHLTFSEISFAEARKAAGVFLEESGLSAIVLLDSLEDFQLDEDANGRAISGLLHYQGSVKPKASNFRIRCCLPTELWHRLMALSTNPIKDFKNRILLHWHPREILDIAAHRFIIYIGLKDPKEAARLRHILDSGRQGVRSFWAELLPPTINNCLGVEERTIPYILRHTQLLPRQLLFYLNCICREQLSTAEGHLKWSPNAIRNGIRSAEFIICEEIFRAFRGVHPGGKDACERCIPELPPKFSDADLHKVFVRHGKKRIQNVADYSDFKCLMTQIGAIGKVMDETDTYVTGQFEYTTPHRLHLSGKDELCLHPVFSVVYNARRPPGSQFPVIYPSGSDIDEVDYRLRFN